MKQAIEGDWPLAGSMLTATFSDASGAPKLCFFLMLLELFRKYLHGGLAFTEEVFCLHFVIHQCATVCGSGTGNLSLSVIFQTRKMYQLFIATIMLCNKQPQTPSGLRQEHLSSSWVCRSVRWFFWSRLGSLRCLRIG